MDKLNKGKGHLKRWMEDATNSALTISQLKHFKRDLTKGEESDLQAMRELEALENAAREILKEADSHGGNRRIVSRYSVDKLRSALKALEGE